MGSWVLVPCLVQLRTEFNELAPNRSKASDGSIGDAAHAESTSDHNNDETGSVPIQDADKTPEVHAIDVTSAGPWPQFAGGAGSMERVVQFILVRCRSGAEKRLRYVIYNRRIWAASWGWEEQKYAGTNPHDKHAHFSASYSTSLEASTASWHLNDLLPKPPKGWDEMATKAEIQAALAEVLADPRPYFLKRLGKTPDGRQWSDLSVDGKLDYILEALVAAANIDADGDGQVDDSASLQARLARLEAGMGQVIKLLTPPTESNPQ